MKKMFYVSYNEATDNVEVYESSPAFIYEQTGSTYDNVINNVIDNFFKTLVKFRRIKHTCVEKVVVFTDHNIIEERFNEVYAKYAPTIGAIDIKNFSKTARLTQDECFFLDVCKVHNKRRHCINA